jgi:hypothetical protein
MQEIFFICMKKSENDFLIEKIKNLMKMTNRDRELDENSLLSSSLAFSENRFRIFHTDEKVFLLVIKFTRK